MENILSEIRNTLKENADEQTLLSSQRFFKETTRKYGVKNPEVRKISKVYFKEIKDLSKEEIFSYCEQLLQSGYMEEAFIACHWSQNLHKKYEPSDFQLFKKWIDTYIDNWATCDTFCNHTMGMFIEKYPEYMDALKAFTQSENRWMKRAAAVSLIVPARKGAFLQDIFEIADALLMDPDDMVQKGTGWLLKTASEAHQDEVFNYLMQHKDRMPRTSLRYALEKMPAEKRAAAMQRS